MIRLNNIFPCLSRETLLVEDVGTVMAVTPAEWRAWREEWIVDGETVSTTRCYVRPATESEAEFVRVLEEAASGCGSRRDTMYALSSLDLARQSDFPSIGRFLEKAMRCPGAADDGNLFILRGDCPDNIHEQGWKVHVSAEGEGDYINLLAALVPALMETNLRFKVVRPECMGYMTGTQRGKYVTVYTPDERALEDLAALPGAAADMLRNSAGAPVEGELPVGGRCYARYGSYVDPDSIRNPYTGNTEPDVRGRACPEWVGPIAAIF